MSQYVDQKAARQSYRPRAGTMSPGLKRAREPYRIKNALVGLGLGAFAVGVWAYSISAVKQDVFDDVDEEAKELAATRTGANATGVVRVGGSAKTEETVVPAATTPTTAAASVSAASIVVSQPLPPVVSPAPSTSQPRGVLQALGRRWPKLLDPERKTLVYGAPSVDNVGKMRS